MASPGDLDGFNRALGFDPSGWVPYEDPDGSENFQILSPVRMRPHGVHEINRRIQRRYRPSERENVLTSPATSLGEEGIVERIIVGQLQHRGEISYRANREMLPKVRDAVVSTALTDGWGHSVKIGNE